MKKLIATALLLFLFFGCNQTKSEYDVKATFPEQNEQTSPRYKNEPDGFRDIKWGTSLLFGDFQRLTDDKLKTDDTIYNLSSYDECLHFDGSAQVLYTKKDDKLMFGDAKISSIRYSTCRSHLYRVIIYGDDYNSFNTIKEGLIYKFGPPSQEENPVTAENYKSLEHREFHERYSWKGLKTNISLSYWHVPLRKRLRMPSSTSPLILTFASVDFEKKAEQARSEFHQQQKGTKARDAAKDF